MNVFEIIIGLLVLAGVPTSLAERRGIPRLRPPLMLPSGGVVTGAPQSQPSKPASRVPLWLVRWRQRGMPSLLYGRERETRIEAFGASPGTDCDATGALVQGL